MRQEQRRRRCDCPDRREVLARIVADIVIHARAGRERGRVAQQQRVAIGRAARGLAGADRAAAARGAVLDHDLLAQRCAHLVGDSARHDVVGAARRQRDHQCDGTARISLRARGVDAERREQYDRNDDSHASHHALHHSAFNPIACASFDQRCSSRSMSAEYSSGAPGIGSAPSSVRRCFISSVARMVFSSRFSRSMTLRGVPAGASRVDRCVASKPGRPLSAIVGISGSRLDRVRLLMPSARSPPAATFACTAGIGANIIAIWPPRRSVSAGPVPL